MGFRLLEVLGGTERGRRRDTRLLDALRFVHGPLWRYLFGRAARDLEQSNTVRLRPWPPAVGCILARPGACTCSATWTWQSANSIADSSQPILL